jgi:hypothetical protein
MTMFCIADEVSLALDTYEFVTVESVREAASLLECDYTRFMSPDDFKLCKKIMDGKLDEVLEDLVVAERVRYLIANMALIYTTPEQNIREITVNGIVTVITARLHPNAM